jgi:hypothetical protein
MTARLCRSLTPAIFMIATATLCAASEPRGSTLRLVGGEQEAGPRFELAGKQTAPPSTPTLPDVVLPSDLPSEPAAEITPTPGPPPQPPRLGDEILQAPNPYETTAPAENYAPQPPGDYFVPHGHGYPPQHRRVPQRVVEHFQNRPRQPQLQQESWLNRPFGLSAFVGGFFMDDPIAALRGDPGTMMGLRTGWDFGPHWGAETRFGWADAGTTDKANPGFILPKVDVWFWDLNWLYYPTGDTRWRPYFTAGFGILDLDYYDASSNHYHDGALSLPFGVGMKYRYSTRVSMRFDLIDHFSFDTGAQQSMHNLTISAGFEGRFGGGSRKNYWPWNPGRDWR